MKSISIKIFSLMTLLAIVCFPEACLALEVVDAAICKDIQGKQPVGISSSFAPDIAKVWCWSKIKDGQGTIRHIYYHNGQEKAVVVLNVLSANFRTYSSKRIMPSQLGQWRVDIVDQNGTVLKSLDFTIEKPIVVEETATTEQTAPGEESASTAHPATTEDVPRAQQ